jgi:hypothetical protein
MQTKMPENDCDIAERLLWKAENNVEAACQAARDLYPRGNGGGVGIHNAKQADHLCKVIRKMATEHCGWALGVYTVAC